VSQHQHDERSQESFEADEAHEYRLDSGQPQLFAQRLSLFIELRFAIALLSVIVLLTMSVVNMVIERLLETALYGLGPYIPGALRVLCYTLPPLALAILLTVLLIWLNGFFGHQASPPAFSNPFGEKLLVSRPPSSGQRLGLVFISAGLVVSLWLTVTIYMRFGPYLSDVLYEVTVARLAAIPLVTAVWLTGAAFWINILFNRRQS
jgi:hypothetical protein